MVAIDTNNSWLNIGMYDILKVASLHFCIFYYIHYYSKHSIWNIQYSTYVYKYSTFGQWDTKSVWHKDIPTAAYTL